MNAKKALLAFLGLAAVVISTGCTTQKDTAIPWSRPATWEGQVPGMGATPGAGR